MKSHSVSHGVARLIVAFLLAIISTVAPHAQNNDWTTPFPGHRVIGNLNAVGTYELGVYLITSDDGHILINSGLQDSVPLIRDNIESLGFRLEDIKILLTMQAHADHTAALAELKEKTGAEMWATTKDARLLGDGGFSDPLFGGRELFRPVSVDRIISDGDVIESGDIRLRVHEHPGHTEGSCSYTMHVHEGGRDYEVAIANLGTINPGTMLTGDATYAGIAGDLARTYDKQLSMDIDVWVAAHGSQYGLHEKYQPGQAYSPDTFVDPDGFRAAVERLKRIYVEQLAEERHLSP